MRPRLPGGRTSAHSPGSDWRAVVRAGLVLLALLGVATRISAMAAGQLAVGAGLAQVVAILLAAAVADQAAERLVRARAASVRAEGIRELTYLLDTVRRLSLANDPDAVVREVIVAAGRSMAREGLPRPRAALIRVVEGRIREGYEHDDIGDMGGYELPLSA